MDAHALAKTNLKKAVKRQKRSYGESSQTVCLHHGDWVWHIFTPHSVGGTALQK